jgi:hypothetical protein
MIKTKTILKDKFWIVEEGDSKVGTLTWNDDKYVLSAKGRVSFFDNKRQLEKTLGVSITEKQSNKIITNTTREVYKYPTSCTPYNEMYDVKRKLPLFTKSAKSKSLYCAGYYIIRFDKGWVQSHCPKLITLERYDYKGPFKTDFEMRQELSNAKR